MLERSAFRSIGVIHPPHLAASRIEVNLTTLGSFRQAQFVTNDEPTCVNKGVLPPSRLLLETKSRRPALPNCPRVNDWPLAVSVI